MRDIKVSPDGNSVAIRSDSAADAPNAYGIFNAINGGHWGSATEVSTWQSLTPAPAP